MTAGLQRIIDRIRKDPSNEKLRDRFLALVAEVEDESVKADYILELAKTLAMTDKKSALEFARMVIDFDPENKAALTVVEEILNGMGRHAKAAVVRNFRDKLQEEQEERAAENMLASSVSLKAATSFGVEDDKEFKLLLGDEPASESPMDVHELPEQPVDINLMPVGSEPAKTLHLDWDAPQVKVQVPEVNAQAPEEPEIIHHTAVSLPTKTDAWEEYLDQLLENGQDRKALWEIFHRLQTDTNVAHARIAAVKLPQIWGNLRLQGFDWKESEGVYNLLQKIGVRPLPTLRGLI